ncbi:hypothetical protein [Flavobacterium aquiphilum]|uniref:hypothetical protein n=1 Tax=Flavobacterium aquiphilum TaxID=3003261 RepID=UPI002480F7BA|nr:hypothetical protein [Flavobacterium aquiphilum]
MKTVLEQLSGATNLLVFLTWFLLAFIGAFIAVIIRAKFNYKYNTDTPYRWSWSFLLQDNLVNLTIGFFISLIFFRFTSQFLQANLNIWLAFILGGASNELALQFVKFSLSARK